AGPGPAWGRTAGPGTLARLFRAVKPGWLRSLPQLPSARARESLENGKDSRARIAPRRPRDEGGTMSGRVPLLALGTALALLLWVPAAAASPAQLVGVPAWDIVP